MSGIDPNGGGALVVPGGGGTSLSDATPAALGTAAAGVSTSASRADHVHAAPAAADITDASATGISLVTAASAAAARTALGVTAPASLLPLCPYATCDGPLTAVGRLRFDPALFAVPGCTLAVALEAVGDVSDAGLTGTATLHDLTDAADVATLSWTGGGDTDPTAKSAAVTPPAAAHDYELQLDLAGGAGYLTLGGAVLRLTWS